MPKLTSLALATGGLLVFAAPALANVTVVNETSSAKTVTFDLGAEEVRIEVAPDARAEHACPEGCGVRFGGHDTMASDGDTLRITADQTRPVKDAN